MAETFKTREAGTAQPLLLAIVELRECLLTILDEERLRLRTLAKTAEPLPFERAAAAHTSSDPHAHSPRTVAATQAASAAIERHAPPPPAAVAASTARPAPLVDREPHFRAASESKPRVAVSAIAGSDSGIMAIAARSSHSEAETHATRPENPRKRLDELAKLLDKRAKQSAESVLKASETKEGDR